MKATLGAATGLKPPIHMLKNLKSQVKVRFPRQQKKKAGPLSQP